VSFDNFILNSVLFIKKLHLLSALFTGETKIHSTTEALKSINKTNANPSLTQMICNLAALNV